MSEDFHICLTRLWGTSKWAESCSMLCWTFGGPSRMPCTVCCIRNVLSDMVTFFKTSSSSLFVRDVLRVDNIIWNCEDIRGCIIHNPPNEFNCNLTLQSATNGCKSRSDADGRLLRSWIQHDDKKLLRFDENCGRCVIRGSSWAAFKRVVIKFFEEQIS